MGPSKDHREDSGVREGAGTWLLRAAAFSCLILTPGPAMAALNTQERLLVLGGITSGAVALAIAAGLWALAEQNVTRRLRRSLKIAGSRTRAALGERDALLSAGRESLIVWGRDGSSPLAYGSAEMLLDSCLKGEDATILSQAMDDLSAHGTNFALSVRDRDDRKVTARGRAVGSMAAMWLEPAPVVIDSGIDFSLLLDALPIPVWLRDKTLSLVWGNRAYLDATGLKDVDALRETQTSIEKSERDLASSARAKSEFLEAKRYAIIAGQRRALAVNEIPLDEMGIAGIAADVTDIAAAEARLQQHIDAHSDTLDKLATAVAIFGRDQKLTFYNRAFSTLWGLPDKWLDKHPTDSEILDRLREDRKLPEQRDYQAWKRMRLSAYEGARDHASEDLWHLPGGKTLRVVAQPHPFGGLTFLYEDVTEKMELASSYNTLIKVQSATLDTLQEGVAVFGPDGKLKLHNAAFTRIWDLKPKDLEGEPHIRTIAATCAEKFGDGAIWEKLIQNIVSGAAVKRDMGDAERSDRSVLSLGLSPLPDGAMLVTFTDVTDHFRIESVLRDRNEALEAADRLKSDFIKHVSYELRTPLNTILGFSEHLASELPGGLNTQQKEYMGAIVSGSNSLKSLINDILDLALIESGAMRLELERVDLFALMSDVFQHAREWATKVELNLDLRCAPDAGVFLADARRVRQIVFNLLSNAFKYTPRGGTIILGGEIVDEDVQIWVSDDGPGISPEVRASVFERFSAKSVSGQRAGAGLGLALVNRFVELHDGWVEIDSNDGTLVRCHLPRRIHDGQSDGEPRSLAMK